MYKCLIQLLLIECFQSARCAWGRQWRTKLRTFPFNFWNHCATFRDSVFHSQHENDYHDPLKCVFSLFWSPMNSLDLHWPKLKYFQTDFGFQDDVLLNYFKKLSFPHLKHGTMCFCVGCWMFCFQCMASLPTKMLIFNAPTLSVGSLRLKASSSINYDMFCTPIEA